ncbi:jg17642 [Pararge aegeria aegeria]|uniref:Jg17642 protein n=2 Tax=Pararge aegeria TaxID=116150 RepID=A0A8S4R5M5_9NEOP|nr:jg17642 [Pararge aegeria aegeria]
MLCYLLFSFFLTVPSIFAEDVSYQACVDKYSRKGYQPWQEWSDHYTCHRYRCEIRDGKYFIAAVGCRKPKIPENALECHEYIEDENVEFPTCCARLRCVVEVNGERIVQTRGQPGELFPDKPWKGQQNEPSPAVVGMQGMQQNTVSGEPQTQSAPGIFNSRGAGKPTDGNDISGRRFVDPYPNQMQDSPRKKRSTIYPLFELGTIREGRTYPQAKVNGYTPEKYTSYFPYTVKALSNTKLHLNMS